MANYFGLQKAILRCTLGIWALLSLLTACDPADGGREPVDRHASKLVFTRHARCRMDCRHITEKEIREILEKGSINYAKSEPQGRPDPKYAFEGSTLEGQHLRVIFAPTQKAVVVITCIDLGVEWQCDCY